MYVDVVIPTYKPDDTFVKLIEMLEKQSIIPFKIIIVNTEKSYFDELLKKDDILKRFPNIRVYHIDKADFDHGKSRNLGASHSDADYVLFMTDDAVPADIHLIENMIKYFDNPKVFATYARQLPRENADDAEIYGREFNYPEVSSIKGKDDYDRLGIKTFFCSNVCAMYDGKEFRKRGGFVDRAIFNEDMYYAGSGVKDGLLIAYAADAKVIHSHNYGPIQQFHRNFDLGVSQADRPDLFGEIKSEGEGIKLVKGTLVYLLKKGKWYKIPSFIICCAFKLLGYKKGKNYKKLSRKKIYKYTMNREYWNKLWNEA